MELTDLHPYLQDMIMIESDLIGIQDWYLAVTDWLYYESSGSYTGGSRRVRASLGYPRELASAPDPEAYPLRLLYDYVKAAGIQESEVFKLAEYFAEQLDYIDLAVAAYRTQILGED